MSFGFPAFHRETVRFATSGEALRAAVLAALDELKWPRQADGPDGTLRAQVKLNVWSWGELVEIVVDGDTVRVTSKCRQVTQCFDWGKNKANVEALLERLPRDVKALDSAHAASGVPVGAATFSSTVRGGPSSKE